MSDIKPKYVDGEPVCSGKDCLQYCLLHKRCKVLLNNRRLNDICIPALRQQRDQAIAERDELKEKIRKVFSEVGPKGQLAFIQLQKLAEDQGDER